jgi:hypothetical protein
MEKVFLRLGPIFHHVGEAVMIDHHQQVVIGDVTADGIAHPIASGVGAVEHDLENAAHTLVGLGAQNDGVLELGK